MIAGRCALIIKCCGRTKTSMKLSPLSERKFVNFDLIYSVESKKNGYP